MTLAQSLTPSSLHLFHFKERIILPLTYLGIPGGESSQRGRGHAHTLPHGSLYREHLLSCYADEEDGHWEVTSFTEMPSLGGEGAQLESRCWVLEHSIPSGCSSETLAARQTLFPFMGHSLVVVKWLA